MVNMTKSKGGRLEPQVEYMGSLFTLAEIPIEMITVPKERFRSVQTPKSSQALRTSVRNLPLINEIGVVEKGGKYELVYGEQRLLFTKQAGGKTIHAKVWKWSPSEALMGQLVENYARGTFDKLALMDTVVKLLETGKYKQKDIADLLGMAPDVVSKIVSLKDLPDQVKEQVGEGLLSVEHALELKRLRSPQAMKAVADVSIDQHFNRDKLRDYIKHDILGECDKCGKENLKIPLRSVEGKRLCPECAPPPTSETAPEALKEGIERHQEALGSEPKSSETLPPGITAKCDLCTASVTPDNYATWTYCRADGKFIDGLLEWFLKSANMDVLELRKIQFDKIKVVPNR